MTFALPDTGAARHSMPRASSMLRNSADPSSEIDEHSTTMRGLPPRAFASIAVITDFTSSHVDTMQKTMSHPASWERSVATRAPCFARGSAFERVRFHARTSAPPWARCAAISKPVRPVPIQPILSVGVGNGELLRGVEGDDLRAVGGEDDFLLDARRRNAVLRRAEGLDREDH